MPIKYDEDLPLAVELQKNCFIPLDDEQAPVLVEITDKEAKFRHQAWALVLNEMLALSFYNDMTVDVDGYRVQIRAKLLKYPPIGIEPNNKG